MVPFTGGVVCLATLATASAFVAPPVVRYATPLASSSSKEALRMSSEGDDTPLVFPRSSWASWTCYPVLARVCMFSTTGGVGNLNRGTSLFFPPLLVDHLHVHIVVHHRRQTCHWLFVYWPEAASARWRRGRTHSLCWCNDCEPQGEAFDQQCSQLFRGEHKEAHNILRTNRSSIV